MEIRNQIRLSSTRATALSVSTLKGEAVMHESIVLAKEKDQLLAVMDAMSNSYSYL